MEEWFRKMKSTAAKIGTALIPVFLLAGCYESTEDIERKPELVTQLADQAVEACDAEDTNIWRTMDYRERLEVVLRNQSANTLDFLIENNIVVCMDDRLPEANHPLTKDIRAMFYPSAIEGGQHILALSDDGEYPETIVKQMISGFYLNYTFTDFEGMDDIQIGYKNAIGNRGPLWSDAADDFFNYRRESELANPPLPQITEEIVEEIPQGVIDDAGEAIQEELDSFGANAPG